MECYLWLKLFWEKNIIWRKMLLCFTWRGSWFLMAFRSGEVSCRPLPSLLTHSDSDNRPLWGTSQAARQRGLQCSKSLLWFKGKFPFCFSLHLWLDVVLWVWEAELATVEFMFKTELANTAKPSQAPPGPLGLGPSPWLPECSACLMGLVPMWAQVGIPRGCITVLIFLLWGRSHFGPSKCRVDPVGQESQS